MSLTVEQIIHFYVYNYIWRMGNVPGFLGNPALLYIGPWYSELCIYCHTCKLNYFIKIMKLNNYFVSLVRLTKQTRYCQILMKNKM